jgi:hypothetical protein
MSRLDKITLVVVKEASQEQSCIYVSSTFHRVEFLLEHGVSI